MGGAEDAMGKISHMDYVTSRLRFGTQRVVKQNDASSPASCNAGRKWAVQHFLHKIFDNLVSIITNDGCPGFGGICIKKNVARRAPAYTIGQHVIEHFKKKYREKNCEPNSGKPPLGF